MQTRVGDANVVLGRRTVTLRPVQLLPLLAAFSLPAYGCVTDTAHDNTDSATADSTACRHRELRVTRSYGPNSFVDAQQTFVPNLTFKLPIRIPVTKGNAGSQGAVLSFRRLPDKKLITCHYSGQASSSHPTDPIDALLGLTYVSDWCDYDARPGDTVTTDTLKLHLDGGDCDDPAKKTEALLVIDEVGPSCAPPEVTMLTSVSVGPNHVIEFHQFASGLTGIIEKGQYGTTPEGRTLTQNADMSALRNAQNGSISLVGVYKKLGIKGEVPTIIQVADASYDSKYYGLAHSRHDDRIMVSPPVRNFGTTIRDQNAADQAWFKSTICDPNHTQECVQGWSWADSGTVAADIASWTSWAYVARSSPVVGKFVAEDWTCDVFGCRWDTLGTSAVRPGWYNFISVNQWPAFATHSWIHTRVSGLPADVPVSLATSWTECGQLGQGTCNNGLCMKPATPVQGRCVPIETRIYDCGNSEADYVSGWAKIGVANTGDWGFMGHAHNSAFYGVNYFYAMALTSPTPSNYTLATAHSKYLGGTLDDSPRVDDFIFGGRDRRIIEQWPTLTNGICTLHESANAWSVTEDVIAGAIVGAGAVAAVVLLGGSAPDPRADDSLLPGCVWSRGKDERGNDYLAADCSRGR